MSNMGLIVISVSTWIMASLTLFHVVKSSDKQIGIIMDNHKQLLKSIDNLVSTRNQHTSFMPDDDDDKSIDSYDLSLYQ